MGLAVQGKTEEALTIEQKAVDVCEAAEPGGQSTLKAACLNELAVLIEQAGGCMPQ
jgi:hypothetical protein